MFYCCSNSNQQRLDDEVLTFTIVLLRWLATEKSSRIALSAFQLAMQMQGQDVELDEVECMVANMIYKVGCDSSLYARVSERQMHRSLTHLCERFLFQGYMKGYISHEKRMVVLAKTNPFPRLSSRPKAA